LFPKYHDSTFYVSNYISVRCSHLHQCVTIFQTSLHTMYKIDSNFSSCKHCHNIQNTLDMFNVLYILQTHFYTIHRYITNEVDKHYLNIIHIHALINNSYNKTSKCTNVKNYFFTHKNVITLTCFNLSWSSSGSYWTSIKHALVMLHVSNWGSLSPWVWSRWKHAGVMTIFFVKKYNFNISAFVCFTIWIAYFNFNLFNIPWITIQCMHDIEEVHRYIWWLNK
jgi:hypothetical protein